MDHDNMRLLRLEKAEYLIPAKDVESVDTRLQRRNPPIDYSIVPLPPPQDPLAAEREAETERAISQMPYDDGDALPEGHYVADKDGKLVRTGPAQVETGWHGTSAPADTAIDLELRAPGVDGRNHLREVPAIYTTTDPLIAQRVAFNRWRRQRDAGKGVEQRPQLYEIVAAPSETVELGDCTDAPSVIAAIDLGADVLKCPDWVNGSLPVPETVILNDDIHHTGRAWQIDELKDLDVSEAMVRAENALIAAPMLSPSIKRAKGMPKYTRYTAQPAKPRKSKASKPKYRHPFLRKRR